MMFGEWGEPDHDKSIRIIHRALDAGSKSEEALKLLATRAATEAAEAQSQMSG